MTQTLESQLRDALVARAQEIPSAPAERLRAHDYRPRTRDLRPPVAAGALLTAGATATAVLLLTDAWLDVTSAAPGDELLTAIAMAVFAEAPIALACIALALRLIRHPFPSATETAGTDTQEEQRCP